MPTEILIIGAGGHSKVVLEALQVSNPEADFMVVDYDKAKTGQLIFGKVPVVLLDKWPQFHKLYHVAIGDNTIRKKYSLEAQKQRKAPITIVHPDASISTTSKISGGCFVAANAVIAAESELGEGCIINHGAVIDHDCKVAHYSHIAPNVTVGGSVIIGERCLIGAGSIILPRVKIGNQVVIGAGAVITCDVPDNQIMVGVPGKKV